jgi:hypothetical protein
VVLPTWQESSHGLPRVIKAITYRIRRSGDVDPQPALTIVGLAWQFFDQSEQSSRPNLSKRTPWELVPRSIGWVVTAQLDDVTTEVSKNLRNSVECPVGDPY